MFTNFSFSPKCSGRQAVATEHSPYKKPDKTTLGKLSGIPKWVTRNRETERERVGRKEAFYQLHRSWYNVKLLVKWTSVLISFIGWIRFVWLCGSCGQPILLLRCSWICTISSWIWTVSSWIWTVSSWIFLRSLLSTHVGDTQEADFYGPLYSDATRRNMQKKLLFLF